MNLTHEQRVALPALASRLTAIAMAADESGEVPRYIVERAGLDEQLILDILARIEPYDFDPATPDLANRPEDWSIRAYREVFGIYPTDDGQLARFVSVVMSIPDWASYAVLYHEFSGEWPKDPVRPQRPDDRNHPSIDKTQLDDSDRRLEGAMEFVSAHTRTLYVLRNDSDLQNAFSKPVTAWLHQNLQVHVLNDLDRFTTDDLLVACLEEPAVLKAVSVYRAGQRAKKG